MHFMSEKLGHESAEQTAYETERVQAQLNDAIAAEARNETVLRGEFGQAREECEQVGEAWTRVKDQFQNNKVLWTAHHIHEKGLEEVDKYRSELQVDTDEYHQAAGAWTRTNDQLQQTKGAWTRQTIHVHERGLEAKRAY